MTALTSLLVRDQRVPVRRIEEAIQKQVVSGGTLEEAILALDLVPENVLCAYQGVLLGMPPLARAEVMGAAPAVTQLVPTEVAVGERLVPVRFDGERLLIAVARAVGPEDIARIERKIGRPVSVAYVTGPRLAAALEAHFNAAPSSAQVALLRKLATQAAGELSYVRAPGGAVSLSPPFHSRSPDSMRADEPGSGTGPDSLLSPNPAVPASPPLPLDLAPSTASAPDRDAAPPSSAGRSQGASRAALSGSAGTSHQEARRLLKVRGALTPARASDALRDASGRDETLAILLEFARQYFDFTALFSVRGNEVNGLQSVDGTHGVRDLEGVQLSLEGPVFSEVLERHRAQVVPLLDAGTGMRLAETLGRRGMHPALLAPLVLRGRPILLLYGDRSGDAFLPADVPELLALFPRVVETFQRILVARKKHASPAPDASAPRSDPKSADDASVYRAPAKQAVAPNKLTSASAVAARKRETISEIEAQESTIVAQESGGTVDPTIPPKRPAAGKKRPLDGYHTSAEGTKAGRVPHEVLWQLGAGRAAPPPPSSDTPPRPENRAEEKPATTQASPTPADSGRALSHRPWEYRVTDLPVEVVPPGSAPVRSDRRSSRPVGARTRSSLPPNTRVGYTPHAHTPSVIVDMGQSIDALVINLMEADTASCDKEIRALLDVGEAALPALVQHFPGPLWWERRSGREELARPREVSAISRALLAFGRAAVPYVGSLLRHEDPNVRYYALLLAGELLSPTLVQEVALRAFDDDAGVRTLTLETLAGLSVFPDALRPALEMFRLRARAKTQAQEHRRDAVAALAACRDGDSLEMLIELLIDPNRVLAERAHEALVWIACQDFGPGQDPWIAWARANLRRHRVEWLIDSLAHPQQYLRARAAQELRKVTGQQFGYLAQSPRHDREVAQRKYKDWWEREGHTHFLHRPKRLH